MKWRQERRHFAWVLGICFMAYACWQGIGHSKWAEGTFWMVWSVSCEFSARNLWDKDK